MPSPFLSLLLLLLHSLTTHSASAPAGAATGEETLASGPTLHACPPFQSPPAASFPFSTTPGYGHPSFQVKCSFPHSTISINSQPFLLLDHQPDSLRLFPSSSTPSGSAALCPRLPDRPIDLSGTPFRLSPDLCPRLSCSSPTSRPWKKKAPAILAVDSFCWPMTSWQRRLLSHPHLLIKGCSSTSAGGCHLAAAAASLSEILLKGVRVVWDQGDEYFSNCSACRNGGLGGGGVCGFDDSAPSKPFLCFASPPDATLRRQQQHPRRALVLTTTLLALSCILILVLSLYAAAAIRRRSIAKSAGDPMAAFLRRHHLRPPIYTYDQLRSATGGFDPGRKIGDGGFGSVYLAQLDDGTAAAVKRLHCRPFSSNSNAAARCISSSSFCNEIMILSSIHHPNLVRLHGYCCDPRGLLLVYDYVPNGTLADHLHGSRSRRHKASLTWPVRVDVALQTASALEYLHFALKPPIVHRDITSSNIFLERDMRIKVGDFGLSRLLCSSSSSIDGGGSNSNGSGEEYARCTGPQGTPGYLDPEYHRSFRLTEKSDVYSFGVLLLELVSGMKAVDLGRDKREVSLADLVVSRIQVGELHQVVDPALLRPHRQRQHQCQGPEEEEEKDEEVEEEEWMGSIEAVAELAFRCVAGDKDDRPNTREIVEELRRIKNGINLPAAASASASTSDC